MKATIHCMPDMCKQKDNEKLDQFDDLLYAGMSNETLEGAELDINELLHDVYPRSYYYTAMEDDELNILEGGSCRVLISFHK